MEPTLEQKKQLNVWAVKRDKILQEISVLTTQLEEKNKKNIELAKSNTELETRINKAEGRLEQFDIQEKERGKLISKEITDLEKIKSVIQGEISTLRSEIVCLKFEKNVLVDFIENLKKVHSDIFERTKGLDKIVEHVSRVSNNNIAEFKKFFDELKISVKEIIDGNKKVKLETDEMIKKVPKILREHSNPVKIIRPILNKKRLVAKGDIPK